MAGAEPMALRKQSIFDIIKKKLKGSGSSVSVGRIHERWRRQNLRPLQRFQNVVHDVIDIQQIQGMLTSLDRVKIGRALDILVELTSGPRMRAMLIELDSIPPLLSLLQLDPMKDTLLVTKAMIAIRSLCLSNYLGAQALVKELKDHEGVLLSTLKCEKQTIHRLTGFVVMDVIDSYAGRLREHELCPPLTGLKAQKNRRSSTTNETKYIDMIQGFEVFQVLLEILCTSTDDVLLQRGLATVCGMSEHADVCQTMCLAEPQLMNHAIHKAFTLYQGDGIAATALGSHALTFVRNVTCHAFTHPKIVRVIVSFISEYNIKKLVGLHDAIVRTLIQHPSLACIDRSELLAIQEATKEIVWNMSLLVEKYSLTKTKARLQSHVRIGVVGPSETYSNFLN